MDAETYREATIDTWNTDPPDQYQPANAALGVVGEVGEYLDDPGVDELGDVLYYVVTLRRLLDLPVEGSTEVPAVKDARDLSGGIAEATKKHVYHGDDRRGEIDEATALLIDTCGYWADLLHTDLDEVRRRNINKLRDRHGDSWSPAEEQDR